MSGKRKVSEVAQIMNVTRKTIHKRKCRYKYYGSSWLLPRKPGPKKGTCWNRTLKEIEDKVVELAREHQREWPVKLTMRLCDEHEIEIDQSTVYRILKRRKIRYHQDYERPKRKKKLYALDSPGRELQVDTSFPFGYQRKFVVYSAIDDCSRLVYSRVCDGATSKNSIQFMQELIRKTPFRIERIRTDQWREFAKTLTEWLTGVGIKHQMNEPYHPEHNGKVERYHRTMKSEEIYQWPYLISIEDANYMLRQRMKYYNEKRRHTGLWMNGMTPKQKLQELSKNVTLILQ